MLTVVYYLIYFNILLLVVADKGLAEVDRSRAEVVSLSLTVAARGRNGSDYGCRGLAHGWPPPTLSMKAAVVAEAAATGYRNSRS